MKAPLLSSENRKEENNQNQTHLSLVAKEAKCISRSIIQLTSRWAINQPPTWIWPLDRPGFASYSEVEGTSDHLDSPVGLLTNQWRFMGSRVHHQSRFGRWAHGVQGPSYS
nr:protein DETOXIFICATION 49-like [Ipomoea batatas]